MDDAHGPALGATLSPDGARFALWSSRARDAAVRLYAPDESPATLALERQGEGFFSLFVPGKGHGTRYSFVLDDQELRDPFARWLPDGVEAPATIWEPRFRFRHPLRARPLREHVLYELHVGTFSREGTYAAAARRLPGLRELGVTTLELMPIHAFPGARGWGYDGVAHFAPFAPYGDPDELRAFVDAAHGLGLSVILDVVYNHFGPSGNVLPTYAPEYFTVARSTPWGAAPSFEHPAMRRYVLENALYWLESFRFDGLRFDAVHAMKDDSPRHILRELAERVAKLSPRRLLVAEDERNDPRILLEHGFDAVWADDFHHQAHVAATGERDGYYAAYGGSAAELAETIERGWYYRGQIFPPTGKPRGKPSGGLEAAQLVYCLENHDQVGNRAFGDRPSERVGTEALRAWAMLLLFLPATPLLFMGQEWGTRTPFCYFTDHEPELGRAVTEGRQREHAAFVALAREVPDPQAVETFLRSKLDFAERERPGHAEVLETHRAMLALRASDPVLSRGTRAELRAYARGGLLVVERWHGSEARRLELNLSGEPLATESGARRLVLTSDARVALDGPLPPRSALLSAHDRGVP